MESRLDGERIKVYKADDNSVLGHHFHNAYELIFIEKGGARFVIGDRAARFGEGSVLFLNDLERHEMEPLPGEYSRYVAILEPAFFDQHVAEPELYAVFKRRPASFPGGFQVDRAAVPRVVRLLEECIREYQGKAPFYESCMAALLVELLVELYRRHREQFPPAAGYSTGTVQAVQGFLDRAFLEELTLEDIARRAHVNKFHLAHIFREATGYTVKQYVLLKRIAHAKGLLYHTGKDIAAVAADSGFNSASNFIRAFKAREGVTPARYRKLLQEKGAQTGEGARK